MAERTGFKLYCSYAAQFEKLSDMAAGQLIKAIFSYVNGGTIPDFNNPAVDMAFSFIKSQLDRDAEAYQETCERNKVNGGLGGRPPKTEGLKEKPEGPEKTERFSENHPVSEEAIKNPPVSGEKEKNQPVSQETKPEQKPADKKRGSSLWFEEFWIVYPKKTGKEAARKAWDKIKPDAELHKKILDAVERAKASEQWQEDNGRFIPYPATWLNQGRWDDEPVQISSQTSTAQRRDPLENPFKRETES